MCSGGKIERWAKWVSAVLGATVLITLSYCNSKDYLVTRAELWAQEQVEKNPAVQDASSTAGYVEYMVCVQIDERPEPICECERRHRGEEGVRLMCAQIEKEE